MTLISERSYCSLILSATGIVIVCAVIKSSSALSKAVPIEALRYNSIVSYGDRDKEIATLFVVSCAQNRQTDTHTQTLRNQTLLLSDSYTSFHHKPIKNYPQTINTYVSCSHIHVYTTTLD
eukprot:m.258641 g.258641  ORF g.258641 m.258641 type:complete len:121 (-) comp36830_c0_seq1:94-456(-)